MQISRSPSPIGLLLRAGAKRSHPITEGTLPILPDISITLPDQVIDTKRKALFDSVVAWQSVDSDVLHPCYKHMMAFPLHLMLMLDSAFPFALLGLVHTENNIQQIRSVHPREKLTITCSFADLRKHPKGWEFAIVTEVSANNELVWREQSINLFRTGENPPVNKPATKAKHVEEKQQQIWALPSDLGRQYAKASGDYNPIHLFPFAAKLFGFKQHIAHGMWSQARCLSALYEQTNEPFSCACKFVKPTYLPGKVNFNLGKVTGAQSFSLTSQSKPAGEKDIIHLLGEICSLKNATEYSESLHF